MKRKNYIPFAVGMAAMCLLASLVGSPLANDAEARNASAPAAGQINGTVSYGQAGVALFSEKRVESGQTLTTANGAMVPTVLAYADEKGGTTYYVAAETIAELLDVNKGAIWNETLNCVDFCTLKNLNSQQSGEDVTVVSGSGDELDELDRKREADQMSTPTEPEFEKTVDTFTEIDPAEIDRTLPAVMHMDQAYFESNMQIRQHLRWHPGNGNYILLTFKNEGISDALVQMRRPHSVGAYTTGDESFATVRLPVGQTLSRAFYLEENAPELLRNLDFIVSSIGGETTCIRVSDEQFMYYGPRQVK